jgi:hypothetical protein
MIGATCSRKHSFGWWTLDVCGIGSSIKTTFRSATTGIRMRRATKQTRAEGGRQVRYNCVSPRRRSPPDQLGDVNGWDP